MKNILQQLRLAETNLSVNFSPLSANAANNSTVNAMKTATQLIAHFFSPIRALASKPVFTLASSADSHAGKGKVVINLFYYIANRNQALSNSTINSLGEVLSKLFKRPVELRLVRVHYPYMNSYILAQYVAINTGRYNFTRIQRSIFAALQVVNQRTLFSASNEDVTNSATPLPAYITGVKIRVSGRLTTQRSVPRQTVQTAQIGSFSDPSSGQEKNVIESASFTSKNKKGAFTVKVWISQLPLTP